MPEPSVLPPNMSHPSNDVSPRDSIPADLTTPSSAVLGDPQAKVDTANCHPPTFKEFDLDGFLLPPDNPDELGRLAHYRVLKRVGEGGMGIVFLAEDPRLQRHVALKVMRPELAQSMTARQRFLREARAMASLRSEHIVSIYEIGQSDELPYIASEFLLGMSLAAWLKEGHRPTSAQLLDFGVQIAQGLEIAHRSGLIHRDIKPANLWVEEPSGRIKLLDFGLARNAREDPQLTATGQIVGTVGYMAPEQAEGKIVDERCDLFSLGCVFYELASGEHPFEGETTVAVLKAVVQQDPVPLEKRKSDLPAGFSPFVMKLLAKDPDDRPATATAVVQSLVAMKNMWQTRGTPSPITPPPNSRLIPEVSKTSENSFNVSDRPLRQDTPPRRSRAVVLGVIGLAATAIFCAWLAFLFFGGSARHVDANDAAQPSVTVPGVSENEIVMGMSAPFSGTARELGREMEIGIRTYFNHVNDSGGITNRMLKLVALDDGYEPERAVANMHELHDRRQVFAILGNVGTPTAERTMPFAISKQMVFFGAFTGAPLLRRDPPDRYVFNMRASYDEETAATVKYLLEIKSIQPAEIAVFAQQDGHGDAGFNGVAKSLRKHGIEPSQILRVGYQRNSVDVRAAVQEIVRQKERIRAVVMAATYRPAAEFIRSVKDAKKDMLFSNVSFVGSNALAEELRQFGPDYATGVIVTQVVPHYHSESTLVRTYRELLEKYYPNEHPNFVSLEGYIDAVVMAEGLRRAGKNLTSETLVDAFESIRDYDIGLGVPLSYGPSEHQASHKVWGTIIDGSGNYRMLELQ
jgi:serine/threonine protein kinase/ABC-type branched-subunit amino acid transport system substrate-binding protein